MQAEAVSELSRALDELLALALKKVEPCQAIGDLGPFALRVGLPLDLLEETCGYHLLLVLRKGRELGNGSLKKPVHEPNGITWAEIGQNEIPSAEPWVAAPDPSRRALDDLRADQPEAVTCKQSLSAFLATMEGTG